jgi:hypothetical protein
VVLAPCRSMNGALSICSSNALLCITCNCIVLVCHP